MWANFIYISIGRGSQIGAGYSCNSNVVTEQYMHYIYTYMQYIYYSSLNSFAELMSEIELPYFHRKKGIIQIAQEDILSRIK